ncbi:MAG: hypothetical protein SWY16_18195 [Cyanobacteriota bacterium]|nr:hypothetical protein [Cyanobacteriota bacterium]
MHDRDCLSPEKYLEREKTSSIKHEYVNGRVYGMAGANDAHNTFTRIYGVEPVGDMQQI